MAGSAFRHTLGIDPYAGCVLLSMQFIFLISSKFFASKKHDRKLVNLSCEVQLIIDYLALPKLEGTSP